MKKILMLLVAALSVFGNGQVVAKTPLEFLVIPIDSVAVKAQVVCGKYFRIAGRTHDDKPIIVFNVIIGSLDLLPFTAQDKFIVVIDSRKTTPTATFVQQLNEDDPLPFHWIIHMDEQGAKEAQPCLPPPSYDPRSI